MEFNLIIVGDEQSAEEYINTVVFVSAKYGVVLLDVYDDAFLTSAGFVTAINVPDEKILLKDSEYFVILNAIAAFELPVDLFEREYAFANSRRFMEHLTFACTHLSYEELHDMGLVGKMKDIDLVAAYNKATTEVPIIDDIENDMDNLVYQSEFDVWSSWCMLIPKNFFN